MAYDVEEMKHLLRSQQFDRTMLQNLFSITDDIKSKFETKEGQLELKKKLADKMMFNIFYEPSTRTRISFASAGIHLGMDVVFTENAREFSSAAKGETLEDSIRVMCQYRPDTIVMRHYEIGASERAAAVAGDSVAIINAGDGGGQHPTQALLDLYTIQNELGKVDDLNIVIGGDLQNGRTARSLCYLLSKFSNIKVTLVSPPELRMERDIIEHLTEHGIEYVETDNELEKLAVSADVIYWTRIQSERIADKELVARCQDKYIIDKNITSRMKEKSIILHPLPRVHEISKEIDSDPRSAYFRQAGNGMFVRMALLLELLQNK